ncbi:hypothetical protein PTKIN_Ptkin15bG0008300 [Pterospermum kingtungense]
MEIRGIHERVHANTMRRVALKKRLEKTIAATLKVDPAVCHLLNDKRGSTRESEPSKDRSNRYDAPPNAPRLRFFPLPN